MFSQTPFEDILRLMWFCGLIFQPRQPVCSLSVRELHFSQFVDEMSTSSPPGSPTKWLEALCVQRFSQTHESTLFECFVSLYFYLTKPLITYFQGIVQKTPLSCVSFFVTCDSRGERLLAGVFWKPSWTPRPRVSLGWNSSFPLHVSKAEYWNEYFNK